MKSLSNSVINTGSYIDILLLGLQFIIKDAIERRDWEGLIRLEEYSRKWEICLKPTYINNREV